MFRTILCAGRYDTLRSVISAPRVKPGARCLSNYPRSHAHACERLFLTLRVFLSEDRRAASEHSHAGAWEREDTNLKIFLLLVSPKRQRGQNSGSILGTITRNPFKSSLFPRPSLALRANKSWFDNSLRSVISPPRVSPWATLFRRSATLKKRGISESRQGR